MRVGWIRQLKLHRHYDARACCLSVQDIAVHSRELRIRLAGSGPANPSGRPGDDGEDIGCECGMQA